MLLLTCVKGLEDIVTAEIKQKLSDFEIVRQEKGFLLLNYNGHPRRLLDLRSVEDIFYVIFDQDGFEKSRSTLTAIKELVQKNSFDDALSYHAQIYSKPKHTNFQVFAHLYGRWNFRRADLEQTVSKAIDQKFRRWKPVRGKAKLEFDIRLFKTGQTYLSLRLTDKYFSNRKYKQADIPGSLKPTVAYALVELSKPNEGDIFLDPFCGAGTILAERARVAPANKIIGSDTSEQARAAAAINTGDRNNVEIKDWDALQIPLSESSVNVIVTNPPFGKKIDKDPVLLPRFLAEADRLLSPGGRLILLNSDISCVEANIPKELRSDKSKDIVLLGEPARIWLLTKNK